MSNVGPGTLGSHTHGHSSLTREGRLGGQQHTQQPTLDGFASHIPQSQVPTNYGSTTSQQNILFNKGDNLNTLTHGSSGYRDGKDGESRDGLINIQNLKSIEKLHGTEHRPSMLNQYTMS